jgi:hypothetical protein
VDQGHVKGARAADKPKDASNDAANDQAEPKFDKPLGSSHDDEIDLRDVAREAAKKSR